MGNGFIADWRDYVTKLGVSWCLPVGLILAVLSAVCWINLFPNLAGAGQSAGIFTSTQPNEIPAAKQAA